MELHVTPAVVRKRPRKVIVVTAPAVDGRDGIEHLRHLVIGLDTVSKSKSKSKILRRGKGRTAYGDVHARVRRVHYC